MRKSVPIKTAAILVGVVTLGGILVALEVSIQTRNSQIAKVIVSQPVTVDFGARRQIIRGFGGSTGWLGRLTTEQARALFNQADGLGLSIARVRIDPGGSASNHWVTPNWADELTNATEAIAANPNAIAIATPWTPPPEFKTGSVAGEPYEKCDNGAAWGSCGGSLDVRHYADYANYLKGFIDYFQSGGVKLYAISIQNEPDATAPWESCYWSDNSQSYHREHTSNAGIALDKWIAENARVVTATGTKLMMPESMNFNTNFATDSLNDPKAASQISIVAGHIYGAAPFYYAQAENAGKEVWMTEHWLQVSGESLFGSSPTTSSIRDALDAAEEIYESMVTGQYSTYVWWWIWNDPAAAKGVNNGLIDSSTTNPAPTYFGDAIGQFSKFVQPGYYRYNVAGSPAHGILVSAYSGADNAGTTHFVIVAINENRTAVSQTFKVGNAVVHSMTPYETSSVHRLDSLPPVAVTGGTFTYRLPAQSITTFVQ